MLHFTDLIQLTKRDKQIKRKSLRWLRVSAPKWINNVIAIAYPDESTMLRAGFEQVVPVLKSLLLSFQGKARRKCVENKSFGLDTDGKGWHLLEVTTEGSQRMYVPCASNVILSPSKEPGELFRTLPTWKFQRPDGMHFPHDLCWTMCQNGEILKRMDYTWEQLVVVLRLTYAFLDPLSTGFMQLCSPDPGEFGPPESWWLAHKGND